MHANLVNIVLAFLEGFALIISPCILPILPIVLSGSLTGKKARPLGIITGFILTFTMVTLFSRAFVVFTHISNEKLRNISFVILFLLGIVMFSNYLSEQFNLLTQRFMRVGSGMKAATNVEGGFFSGILFGGLIGIIWTPCAGPILAAIIVQVVIQQTTVASVLTVIAFAVGAGLPMLFIALLGRNIMSRFTFFQKRAVLFRKLLGFIVMASVVFLIYDGGASFSFNRPAKTLSNTKSLINGLEYPYPAPEIAGIDAWINSKPLQLSALRGKVVLIDFWTYSCINCIRTLPYLKDWYAKYHDKGLVIIGVHSPEFAFEHDLNNVKNAVIRGGILYPVALDNRFVTWQLFHNEYWPAHYLINKEGNIVYEHFGEGEYEVTENNIRVLLGMQATSANQRSEENYSSALSPETYFGYERAQHFANADNIVKDLPSAYHYPATLAANDWALSGKWTIYPDRIVALAKDASLQMHFHARHVYAVMGLAKGAKPVKVKIKLNGNLVASPLTIQANKLYPILNLQNESDGVLELSATNPGLELYTFTFGG